MTTPHGADDAPHGAETGPDFRNVPTTPSQARIYDYLLGGKDNFTCDRLVAERMLALMPSIQPSAFDNRGFLQRTVRYLVSRGVRQFLDFGCGLPTQGNVHEVAHEIDPGVSVVYIDNDPVVISHAEALLNDSDRVRVLRGDLREPAKVLSDPKVHEVIDFGEPVAVLLIAVMHFIDPVYDPAGLVRAIRDKTVPGSYLAVSNAAKIEGIEKVQQAYEPASKVWPRTRAEVADLFDGYVLLGPGVVSLGEWSPGGDVVDQYDAVGIGAVGRKR